VIRSELSATGTARGRQPQGVTLRRNPTRKLPKAAEKLSATVWFLAAGPNNRAQALTMHEGWAYWCPAAEWNPAGMIDPQLLVLP
jgi:hypothetical protein